MENYNCIELSKQELIEMNGGGFAYDVGFAWRCIGVYLSNGGGEIGQGMAAAEIVINYKPLN